MKWFFVTLFGAVLLAPAFAFAADTSFFGPIVPQCTFTAGNLRICQACDLIALIDNILRFMVTGSVLVAAAMFAYAGFLYITNPSNAGNVKTAHGIFTNVFVGLVIILIAWLAIDIFMRILAGKDLRVLSRIDCVKFEPGSGWSDIGGGRISSSGRTATGGGVSGGGPGRAGSGTGAGLNDIEGTTTYLPYMCADTSEQSNGTADQRMEGCQLASDGSIINTIEDYNYCFVRAGAQPSDVTPVSGRKCSDMKQYVTVAIPQGSSITLGQCFTWGDMAKKYGMNEGTVFCANDRYGTLGGNPAGYTPTGITIDVATCWRTLSQPKRNCNIPVQSTSIKTRPTPTPVPGG